MDFKQEWIISDGLKINPMEKKWGDKKRFTHKHKFIESELRSGEDAVATFQRTSE
jgi:hypothetical protein